MGRFSACQWANDKQSGMRGAQLCATEFASGGLTMWGKILVGLSGCGLCIDTPSWVDCCR